MKYLRLIKVPILILLAVIPTSLNAQNILEPQTEPPALVSATELLERGRQKLQEGAYREAIDNLNQAILLNPKIANSYYYRGLVRAKLEDQLGAISDFEDAILRDPHHSWAYYHRAGVFFNLDNQSEAILDLQ